MGVPGLVAVIVGWQMGHGDAALPRVPNFPDPANGGSGGLVFSITEAGFSDAASHTQQFVGKLNECGRLAGANAPGVVRVTS